MTVLATRGLQAKSRIASGLAIGASGPAVAELGSLVAEA